MHESASDPSPYKAYRTSAARIALAAFLSLAVAMGIGRFAFTPLLPMMMSDAGLSLSAGSWLASSNYAGYLLGALSAGWFAPRHETRVVRGSLMIIALATLLAGFTHQFVAWMLLRALAGLGSAWVMVHVAAWSLRELTRRDEAAKSARVFGGVGAGIMGAGLAVLVLGHVQANSAQAWLACGALALLASVVAWPSLKAQGDAGRARTAASQGKGPHDGLLVFGYGAYGFGYIIPATFLPALARQAMPDPAVFNWVWPLFGAVAVMSTLAAAAMQGRVKPRSLWIATHMAIATGVALLAWPGSLATIVLSALCVGGSFMVTTIAAFQMANHVGGARATRLIAAMTAAFAVGQIAGPLCLGWFAAHDVMGSGVLPALALAVAGLLASAWALGRASL